MENLIIKNKEQESAKNIENAIINDQNAIPYSPQSTCVPLGTLTPLSLYGEILEAQAVIREEIGESFDTYVQRKLKYTSKVAMCSAFAAEQVDAIAIAIYQIEKNKGLIVADQAGIGKGRVAAGVLRYAFVNGYLPVFVTEKDNLFSDLYRDLKDIGGFGQKGLPEPFILNGHKSGGFEYDEETGQKVKNEGSSDIIMDGKLIFAAQKRGEILEVLNSGTLPNQYNLILSTYDQFSAGGLREAKQNFILKNSDKIIMVLDEAHNAAGSKSKAGKFFTEATTMSQGCVFMSATFSKRPDNIFLYVNKTDITKSALPSDVLIKSVQEGGDKLVEYLSSSLARSGQLIRRERSFANCGLATKYTEEDDVIELFNQFDLAIEQFLKLLNFCGVKPRKGGTRFKLAKYNAIVRYAKLKNVTLAKVEDKPDSLDIEATKRWYQENEGKYFYEYYAGNLTSSLFSFVETLLFSLKAKLVTDTAILELTNLDFINKSVKGTELLSNRKPIIAIRSTLESIYETLGIRVGEEYENGGFSKFLEALTLQSQNGTIRLKEVKLKDYLDKLEGKKKGEGKKHGKEIKEDDWQINSSDYDDNGQEFQKLYDEATSLQLDLPLSPIDFIIDGVQSAKRKAFDLDPNEPGTNFRVGEVTGRKYRFTKLPNGKYTLIPNPKEKNKFKTFSKFNNGYYDALLINESGSTGASVQSSPKFADSRPRSMIIHQVELDINTEVQKRGRINRTGQLYYPTYIYAVSRIPSEIRRLNMMARKLRTLDAGTTANQKQSSKQTEILDRNGNPVQDLINKYGFISLSTFLSDPENEIYRQYEPSEEDQKRFSMEEEDVVTAFLRNIELIPAQDQEKIYDSLNAIYIDEKEKAIAAGTYTEETEIKDLNATPKNRVKIKIGEGDSPFNEPVFEEDNYVNREDKPLTMEEIEELASKFTQGERTDKWYEKFKEDFDTYFKKDYFPRVKNSVVLLPIEDGTNELEKQAIEIENKEKIKKAEQRAIEQHETLKEIFDYFKPLKPVKIPEDFDVFFRSLLEENPDRKMKVDRGLGMFVGYKITDNGSQNKYSPMNIELVFAKLTGVNKVSIKPTYVKNKPNTEILYDIMNHEPNPYELKTISMWNVDTNERIIAKFLTGNILDAYQDAVERTKTEFYKSKIEFLKFTTFPEKTIRFGLRLYMYKYIEAKSDSTNTLIPINSKDLIRELERIGKEFVEQTGDQYETFLLDSTSTLGIQFKKGEYRQSLTLYIFGGLMKSGGEKRAYFSKNFYNNDEFLNLNDLAFSEGGLQIRIGGTSKKLNVKSTSIYGREGFDESDEKGMYQLFDYIFQKQGTFVNLRLGETKETLEELEDVYELSKEKEKEDAEIGEFKYYLLTSYAQMQERLNSFNKFKSFELSDVYANGVVTLLKKPNIKEVISYNLAPIEITPKEIYSNIISLLSEKEKIDFVNDIKKMVNEGEKSISIYLYIEKLIRFKVFAMEQVFGSIAKINIGKAAQIVVDYIKSPDTAEAEAKIEIELPEEGFEEQEMEKVPLDMETAQEFLILMQYNL